jgi:Tol biopolymer transport system component
MLHQHVKTGPHPVARRCSPALVAGILLLLAFHQCASAQASLAERLKASAFKIAYECYVDGNWEIFVSNADGTGAVNLTRTPKEHEHYPQVSPDGTKICFSIDQGEGRDAVRSLWVMDIDGKNRKKLVDGGREPFWSPDDKLIGFLPQEFPKFNVVDYSTKGMSFYNLETGKVEPHPNSEKLHHLYNPSFAPNGKWIAATVHAGMGVGHAILLIEAHGDRIINLKIPGCRPCIAPDGKQIAWGAGDYELAMAPINLDAETPSVGEWRLRIRQKEATKLKIYHIDWSPDSRFVSFSSGPDGEGDLSKPGTFHAACEIVGVHAKDWNIYAVSAEGKGTIDLTRTGPADLVQITTNGASNKEPAWFAPKPAK